jgi:hypothetical protein
MVITALTVIAHIGGVPVEELALLAPYGALAVAARVVIARATRRQKQTHNPHTQ